MEQNDLITIPPSVVDQLKKNVDKYILKDKKPEGFEEALRYVALEKATKSQIAKLNSFSNHHSLSNEEDKEKIEILDKMIVFAKNWTIQYNRKKELSNKSEPLQTIQLEHPLKSNLEGRLTDFNQVFHRQDHILRHRLKMMV